jgi:uncharacterized membrane protein HdeD (DUF308 family)
MTNLDDFLEPLYDGVWEVAIPKDLVTQPLDSGWKKSAINVPSPGTIASYRKGRFHVHETKSEWRVHLDRYDPKARPLLHLVDDAPLLLMISDTFMTLILDTRRGDIQNTDDLLKTQRFVWQEQVVLGLLSVLVGFRILRNPAIFFMNIFEMMIPLAILALAGMLLLRSIRSGLPEDFRKRGLIQGIGMVCLGIFAYVLPLALWVTAVLVLLAVWMVASAAILLRRVVKGRSAVPEGFFSRMAIGILSLVSAVFLLTSPADILLLLMVVLGLIMFLLGITLCINGLRLRAWMRANSPNVKDVAL